MLDEKPLFVAYFSKLDLTSLMPKGNFFRLVDHMLPAAIDPGSS